MGESLEFLEAGRQEVDEVTNMFLKTNFEVPKEQLPWTELKAESQTKKSLKKTAKNKITPQTNEPEPQKVTDNTFEKNAQKSIENTFENSVDTTIRTTWSPPDHRSNFDDSIGESDVQSEVKTTHEMSVFCCTWNMMGKCAEMDDLSFIPQDAYHVYVIGTQECERTIAQSAIKTSRKNWDSKLLSRIGASYSKLRSHTLQAIHSVVFVRTELLPLISNIGSAAIATGFRGTLGNKGGAGVSFTFGKTSFLFVSSHFEAHQEAVQQRNDNFHRIDTQIPLPPGFKIMSKRLLRQHSDSSRSSSKKEATTEDDDSDQDDLVDHQSCCSGYDTVPSDMTRARASARFDRVFWLGDLNYRINLPRKSVDELLAAGTMDSRLELLAEDQLKIELSKGSVFHGFEEGPLMFFPTYKYDKDSSVYDTSKKQRVPSWTDRILHKSAKQGAISQTQYYSYDDVRISDHRPVIASYKVGLEGVSDSTLVGTMANEVGQSPSQVCGIM